MQKLENISNFVGKHMAIIVLFAATISLFIPSATAWIKLAWITPLLMVIMFGMGLTVTPGDFAIVFKRPKEVIIGCLAQFLVMPFLAFFLGKLFALETGLLVGVILVGTCPGGTSSNVMTYLSKGDVALSVGMTCVSTILAPFLTPLITYFLLRSTIEINMISMFLSIVKVVLIPIGLGMIINHFFGKTTQKAVKVLPLVSVIAIVAIVASVVSANSHKILTTGAIVFLVVILHNFGGYLIGYLLGKALHMGLPKQKAIAIEIGMQNSGLATSLAGSAFPNLAMATVPGAIFSVWHNISGAIIANIFANIEDKKNKDTDSKINAKTV